ncbi:MAG: hypothetical protein AAGE80_09805 [Pseudomonadota bacterium]
MPSREVARLRRLRVDNMQTDRLRTELNKATENFAQETERRDEETATMRATLRRVSTQADTLSRQMTAQADALKAEADARLSAEAEAGRLRALLEQAQNRGLANADATFAAEQIGKLEIEKVQLTSQLAGAQALLDKLQKDAATRAETRAKIATQDLYTAMATEVSKAAEELPEGFVIDDVEVQVRGALGREGDNVVLGLDENQQITDETATSLKFTLRRAVTETKLD